MTVRECLVAARKKIEDPLHWTQGALGRDEDENDTAVENACKWCAAGAVWAVCDGDNARATRRLLDRTAHALFRKWSIILINDGSGGETREEAHTRVLEVYDRAITNER